MALLAELSLQFAREASQFLGDGGSKWRFVGCRIYAHRQLLSYMKENCKDKLHICVDLGSESVSALVVSLALPSGSKQSAWNVALSGFQISGDDRYCDFIAFDPYCNLVDITPVDTHQNGKRTNGE